MPTLQLHLLHHSIRTRAPLNYEIVAYFKADQPLPRQDEDIPPWEYSTVEATLVQAAALPVNFDCFSGLTIEHPTIHIHGRRALVKQQIHRP
ncbi:MAG: hypothetical protein DCC55_28350 [Chloroflexi bacterium]|nr:MAG: hypothetical protein DCC55_28350 [Chloroflexota bacterium]